MRHLCLLALLGWLLPICGYGQPYFSRRYQNPLVGQQLGFTTVVPTDSGAVAAGIAHNYPTPGQLTMQLTFLDAAGAVRRNVYFNTSPDGMTTGAANSIHHLADGGYIIAANRTSSVFPFTNSSTLWRLNAVGDTLWTKRWQREEGEVVASLGVLPDGDLVFMGWLGRSAGPSGNCDFLLTRTDSAGNERWWRTYDNAFQDQGYTLSMCPDGGFLLGGYTSNQTQSDSYLVKTDALGNLEWQRTFGSPTQDDGLASVLALRDGTYLVGTTVGAGGGSGTTTSRPRFYRLDAQGQPIWQRTHGPSSEATEIYTLHELADGSVVASGQQGNAIPQQLPEALVLKLCPTDGDTIWSRTHKLLLGPDSHNYLRDLRPTADGGFVGAGFLFAVPPDTGSHDGWVFRLDSAGYIQAGGAPPTLSCRPVGLGEVPAAEALGLEVWPNPAPDGRFTVRVRQAGARYVVSDALGRVVARGALGGSETALDLRHGPPGLYLLRLTWPDGRTATRKLVR